MVPEWQWEGYQRLRAEIIRVAVEDYKAALRKSSRIGKKCSKEAELERFFLSGWGQTLSGDNGQYIIDMCRKDHRFVKSGRSHQKLSVEVQRELVGEYLSGKPVKEIAKKYKVSNTAVYACVERFV